MSDKDFVPYEIAKKLKEAGFDWTCQNFYIEKKYPKQKEKNGMEKNVNMQQYMI